MRTLRAATWPDIQRLRAEVAAMAEAPTLVGAAQQLSQLFCRNFDSVVLARVFAVLPFADLPAAEREFAARAGPAQVLTDKTPVLCLLGSSGHQPAWNDRSASRNHLAIPLASSEAVHGAPMIAKLLSDLQVNVHALDDGRPVATREMLSGRSPTFFVADAATTADAEGRLVIPARGFVADAGVRSVFGSGGSYLDGTLLVIICFCAEPLDRETADRFANFIGAFKLATTRVVQQGRIFPEG
jgi:hypothetical protein